MVTIDTNDEEEIRNIKCLFKEMAEIFIKYFSVNWIFSGRLQYKKEHLKYRFNLLRRLRNPELFTASRNKDKITL